MRQRIPSTQAALTKRGTKINLMLSSPDNKDWGNLFIYQAVRNPAGTRLDSLAGLINKLGLGLIYTIYLTDPV